MQLQYKGKIYHIGRFDDVKLAIHVRDEARKARENENLDEWIHAYRERE